MRHLAIVVAAAALTSCARQHSKPDDTSTAPTRTTQCWVGQLTKIDETGYKVSSVPMLLRVRRDPSTNRMHRDLAIGHSATLQQDTFFVADDGSVSFVETDLRAKGYEASGAIEGDVWSSTAINLELSLPEISVRTREWEENGVLYGHYRYRDGSGEYGDERFHALLPIDSTTCSEKLDAAGKGRLEPSPSLPAWAAEATPRPSTVQLAFEWPANLDATIRTRISRQGTPGTAPRSVDASYQLRTWPEDDGHRIEVRSRELLAVPQHTLEDKDRWDRARVLASLFPAIRVDFDGGVTALAEPDDYLDVVRAAFIERFAGGDSKDDDANEYLDANLSPDLAVISAQRYWNPLVAFWAGAQMEVGVPQNIILTRALWFPGAVKPVEVQVPVEYAFEGWVPCQAGGEPKCVKLVSEYSINEHDVRMPLSQAGPDNRPVRVMKHLDRTRSVLVAEPDTLLPHRYFEERVLQSVTGGATDQQSVDRREVMDLTFLY